MHSNIKGHTFISRVCYICLCADKDKLESITKDIFKKYQFITEISVLLSEITQPNICHTCTVNITKFAQFKRKCLKSYSFWKDTKVTSCNVHQVQRQACHLFCLRWTTGKKWTSQCSWPNCKTEKENLKQETDRIEFNVKHELLSDIEDNADSVYCNDIEIEVLPIENKITNNCDTNDEELKNTELINSKRKRNSVIKQCNKCERQFSYKKTYFRHVKMCDKGLKKGLKTSRKNTAETLHPEECTYCGHCNITFKDLELLKNHLDSLKEEIQCTLCDFKAIDYAMLIAHRYSHLPENFTIFCHTCSKTFYVRLGLEYHYRSEHLHKNANICLRCNKEFGSYRMWRRHAIHHEWRYQCDKCKARFWHKFGIIDHVQSHMYGRRYICDICGYSTDRLNNLRSHKDARHTKYERVTCDLCNISLKNERSLIRHTKMQHTVNVCCNVCGKGFANDNVLKLHMVWHGDVRPYKCDTCFKAFKAKASLKVHLKTHTREKLHECNVCHVRFTSSSSLKRHRKLHAISLEGKV